MHRGWLVSGAHQDGFGEKSISIAREANMAILGLLPERNGKAQTDAPDEIGELVTVEDKRVHHADTGKLSSEVEPNGEGKPLPLGFARCTGSHVCPFNTDDRAHRPTLLHGHTGDSACVVLLSHRLAGSVG